MKTRPITEIKTGMCQKEEFDVFLLNGEVVRVDGEEIAF